jgi:hypothetical protein
MLQNGWSRRNIRSFRGTAGGLKSRVCDGRLANILIVRLSSGISANILDFSPPQKHVLGAMPVESPAAKLVVMKSGPYEASRRGCDSGKKGNELEIRNPAFGQSNS